MNNTSSVGPNIVHDKKSVQCIPTPPSNISMCAPVPVVIIKEFVSNFQERLRICSLFVQPSTVHASYSGVIAMPL